MQFEKVVDAKWWKRRNQLFKSLKVEMNDNGDKE
jgi:hypothetical protein